MVCVPCVILLLLAVCAVHHKFVQPFILHSAPQRWKLWFDSILYPTCPLRVPSLIRLVVGFCVIIPSVCYAATREAFLINDLCSKEPIIKLFALRKIQRICSGTAEERRLLYTLSNPGGHPRNWHALRSAALQLVHSLRARLQQQTHCRNLSLSGGAVAHQQKRSTSPDGLANDSVNSGSLLLDTSTGSAASGAALNEMYRAKQSFFVPPTLNPRPTDAFLSERLQSRRRRLIGLPHFVDLFASKIAQCFFVSPPILPSYDTLCALYAVRALASVIAHSLAEDEFGVVQKDLKTTLAELTRLSIAIDAYVRASGRTSKQSIEQNIRILDECLAENLRAVGSAFGPLMAKLDLHPMELEVFHVLVR